MKDKSETIEQLSLLIGKSIGTLGKELTLNTLADLLINLSINQSTKSTFSFQNNSGSLVISSEVNFGESESNTLTH